MSLLQEPFYIRNWSLLAVSFFLFIFALVVGFYEHISLDRAEWRTRQYGHFLALPLWNQDLVASEAVIELIFRSNEYRAIEVIEVDGQVFVSKHSDYGYNSPDRVLVQLGLLGESWVEVPIVHQDRLIGRLKVAWINRNIYIYVWVLLFLVLLTKLAHSYVSSQRVLERRVAARTAQLLASNERLALEIAERSRVEKALAHSDERYEAAIKQSNYCIALIDAETLTVLEANPAFQRLLGYDEQEVQQLNFYDFVDLDRKILEYNVRLIVKEGKHVTGERYYRHKDGDLVLVEIGADLISYGGRDVVCVVSRDISERKQSEQELIRIERLGALGEMASGIAHDFNNTLSMILGYSDMLLMDPESLKNHEYVAECLEIIRTSSQDAAEVVRRLRAFYRYRDDNEVFHEVNLNDLVEQVTRLTQPKWSGQAQASGRTITLETELGEVPMINGNEAELREVLTNMIFNSVDAMPEGGVITLRTRCDENERVFFSVSDTGQGMDAETRRRCMEPFYTTKGEQGTGLGLGLVHGIVRRHEGEISLDSVPGRGTTFTIDLPAKKPEADDGQMDVDADHSLARKLRVLAVDDDRQVLEVIRGYLVIDGHEVVMANDGREGLEAFIKDRFDVVISDQAMPHMNGTQLAKAIAEIAPGKPFIMVSGFADEQMTSEDNKFITLTKPITLTQLRTTLQEVVGG